MITVASAVKKVMKSSPLIEEGLSRRLINISAVAREIRPAVEKEAKKEVSAAAIVMALKRLQQTLPAHLHASSQSVAAPDLIVRSDLVELTYQNSSTLNERQQRLLSLTAGYRSHLFLTITTGVFETTIISSRSLEAAITSILKSEPQTAVIRDLSSITVRLSRDMIEHAGSYATIMRQLAWDNINIVEVVSTYQELTLIVCAQDADKVLRTLRS